MCCKVIRSYVSCVTIPWSLISTSYLSKGAILVSLCRHSRVVKVCCKFGFVVFFTHLTPCSNATWLPGSSFVNTSIGIDVLEQVRVDFGVVLLLPCSPVRHAVVRNNYVMPTLLFPQESDPHVGVQQRDALVFFVGHRWIARVLSFSVGCLVATAGVDRV
jgi:hypothetical protein